MTASVSAYQQARQTRDPRFDGRFFVAVKSTGIFCRPICPAPVPKELNVEYFDLAQCAIDAGYRPCLRCRPDSAPGSYAWRGVDTTVERAVNLLKTCPHLNLSQICEKLGISDRYLRDLFRHKLGISPKRFRLYDQLLFAKQLLHQSCLSVEDVAQASGFSSARRLQENLQQTLQLTPTQIRRQLPQSNSSSHQGVQLQMAFRAPYNWPQVRDFLQRRAIAGIEEVTADSYGRSFSFAHTQGWFDATYNEKQRRFDVTLDIDDMGMIIGVVGQIRRILDLDADPDIIEKGLICSGLSPELLCCGLRIPGVWGVFEAGCRAILGQQISVSAAIKLVNQLASELGQFSGDRRLFPTPEAVAADDLNFLRMPTSRRECLRRFAQYCCDQPDPVDLSQWLQLKGIGPWTVSYAQLRGQSQPDIWLNNDLVIKQQLAKYALDGDAAAPWRSYLTFQLWSLA